MTKTENMVGIFTTDANLAVSSWDDWLTRVTGIAFTEAQGRHLLDLFPDLETRNMVGRFTRVLVEGVVEVLAPAFHHYLITCAPAAASRHYDKMQQRVTIAPLREEGSIVGTIVTIEDVTPRLDRERDLAEQLTEPEEAARLDAARALYEQESLNDAEPLLSALGDESWRVRRTAVDGLARHAGPDTIKSLLRALRDEHQNLSVLNGALQVLAVSGVDVLAPLVECLNGPDVDLRVYAAQALAEQHDRRAIPALMRAIEDENPNVKYHAIEALGTLSARDSVDALAAVIETGDFFLAFPALDALMKIGDSRVAPRLVSLLDDEMLRTPAADALGELVICVAGALAQIGDRRLRYVARPDRALRCCCPSGRGRRNQLARPSRDARPSRNSARRSRSASPGISSQDLRVLWVCRVHRPASSAMRGRGRVRSTRSDRTPSVPGRRSHSADIG